ncbi:hypothetical protein [Flavobacterium capsici]|uniref:Calx-beta domain-containing protein n=1 Tax=Flavobacterium capsici TaxID=3075618 RepID=A0AA96J6G5_9FLAO|nr:MULTISPECIES: hypothetical protein [unclassified Flavobacterium]WNM20131.1 hypothetical protein RN608_05490 [Flavobacterium sp. PMR2A8]WNM21521.1 hypothetical protein RN605_12660 [Flavobacterium sp. PMTSA4]
MKKIFKANLFTTLALVAVLFTNCDKDDATGYSNLEVAEDVVGTITFDGTLAATQTVKEGFEDTYSYTITLDKPQVVDIHVSVKVVDGTATEDEDFSFDHEVIIPAYSTTGTGTISILNDTEEEGDETVTLQISNVNTSNASIESKTVTFTIEDCYSDLAGTCTFSTTNVSAPTGESAAGPLTGSVTLTETAAGVYELSDASFGGWIGLYGPGNIATGVSFKVQCGTLSYDGEDQYGEVFTLSNLVINGSSMSFHWENDYGEYGDTTITRTDGNNWPALTL